MLKQILSFVAFTVLCTNISFAQLKVENTTGKVGVGTLTPLSKLHMQGDAAVFTVSAGTPTSAAYIRGNNSYSTASTPDYTWYGNTLTGMFHPGSDAIGFTINSNERLRIDANSKVTFTSNYLTLGGAGSSAAMIRGLTAYSTASTPDYTWWGNDLTGMFHPGADAIGFTINSNERLRMDANSKFTFTSNYSSLTTGSSAAMIRGNTAYSAASTPDYTWWGDDLTGIFHPANNEIAMSIGGNVKMRMVNNAVYFPNSTYFPTSAAFIRLTDSYSTASAPDYTWYNDSQTGLFHPTSGSIIGFSIAGSEKMRIDASGNVGMGLTSNPASYRLYISGSAYASGGTWTASDQRFKKNIEQVKDGLALILKLNGKRYEYQKEEFKDLNFEEGKHLGFIAQELEKVLPEAVKLNNDGYYAVNYDAIIPVLAEAIKEQNKLIQDQSTKITQLEAEISSVKTEAVGLSNAAPRAETKSSLFQNKPNPFNKETIIEYNIEQEGTASILIFDMNGKLMKTIPVKIPGKGNVTVNGNDLSAGMYYYTLLVNDREVDTKKMILTN